MRIQDAHLSIAWRSLRLSLITTVACLLLGFPTAYFIATRTPRNRNLWLFLITVPFWTNLLIRTFAMLEWIRNEGIINQVLMGIGPDGCARADALHRLFAHRRADLCLLPADGAAALCGDGEAGFPAGRGGLRPLRDTLARVLWRVIIPLVKPGIVAGSILVFIPSLGAYVTPRVMGGGKNMMLGNLIELQFGQGRNWPLGAALSMTLLVLVMVALLFYVRGVQRAASGPWLGPASRSGRSRASPPSRSSAFWRSTRRW